MNKHILTAGFLLAVGTINGCGCDKGNKKGGEAAVASKVDKDTAKTEITALTASVAKLTTDVTKKGTGVEEEPANNNVQIELTKKYMKGGIAFNDRSKITVMLAEGVLGKVNNVGDYVKEVKTIADDILTKAKAVKAAALAADEIKDEEKDNDKAVECTTQMSKITEVAAAITAIDTLIGKCADAAYAEVKQSLKEAKTVLSPIAKKAGADDKGADKKK